MNGGGAGLGRSLLLLGGIQRKPVGPPRLLIHDLGLAVKRNYSRGCRTEFEGESWAFPSPRKRSYLRARSEDGENSCQCKQPGENTRRGAKNQPLIVHARRSLPASLNITTNFIAPNGLQRKDFIQNRSALFESTPHKAITATRSSCGRPYTPLPHLRLPERARRQRGPGADRYRRRC
jgi:hypothetical protein